MSKDSNTDLENDTNEFDSFNDERKEKGLGFDEIYELPLGKELAIEMTYRITARNKSSFIVVAGPSDCGKTTLTTMVYQIFQKGPVNDCYFAGSETLQGFEQRAFMTRIDSNISESQTPKTRRGAFDILHLRVLNSKYQEFKDLLITDFSGEDYSSAIGNVEMMKREFGVIRSASNILIIIDGNKISNSRTKFGEIENALDLLSTIIDAGLLSKFASVEVTVSKYDILLSKIKDKDAIEGLFNSIQMRFEERFKARLNTIKFSKIASMPNDIKEVPIAYGLDGILESWVDGGEKCLENINEIVLPIKMTSQFNLFKMRHVEVTK